MRKILLLPFIIIAVSILSSCNAAKIADSSDTVSQQSSTASTVTTTSNDSFNMESTIPTSLVENTTVTGKYSTITEFENAIDLKYDQYISNTQLSNYDLGNNIDQLSDEWNNKASEYYELLMNKLSDDGKETLKAYWDSQKISNNKQLALFEKLITKKYESGSIGGIEMAKLEYKMTKQFTLDIVSMYSYLD
jgi:hypothetical protein